jgi:hypothetical protein
VGEALRPDYSPQRELDKPSQINYTMNRKSADRNMASSTFPFKSKRLTAEFVRLGAVNLFCFYFKNPLYQAMAQGVCFAVLFQPECNFTPR